MLPGLDATPLRREFRRLMQRAVPSFLSQFIGANASVDARTAIGIGSATEAGAGLVELATTAETQAGTDSTRAVTPRALAASMLGGVGQAWVGVTGSRAVSTTYTNSTGRPIQLAIRVASAAGQAWTLTIGGVAGPTTYSNSGIDGTLFAVVQPGATYVLTGGTTINNWSEFR